jgi:V8-like Glu-specific endopeptidase
MIAALTLAACGGVSEVDSRESVGRTAQAVQGGRIDTSGKDSFAVGVVNKYGNVCTATLIAPNLVLTARHCVIPPSADDTVTCASKFSASVAPSYLQVTTSPNLYRASFYKAIEVITPASDAFCGNDIALIMLEKNIPASEATPVTPLVEFRLTDHSKISGEVVAIGFGVTNPSADDSGQRRIRTNINITCVPGDVSYASCAEHTGVEVDEKAEFVTEGWVCSGDSGSGAFEQKSFDSGKPLVLGTLSRGPQTTDTCLAAVYTRTDSHAALIVDAGRRAAEKGGYAAPDWTSSTEPAADPSNTECHSDGTCTDTSATDPGTPPDPPKSNSGCSSAPTRAPFGAAALAALGLAIVAIARRRHRR